MLTQNAQMTYQAPKNKVAIPHLTKRVYPGMADQSFTTTQIASKEAEILERKEVADTGGPMSDPFGGATKQKAQPRVEQQPEQWANHQSPFLPTQTD